MASLINRFVGVKMLILAGEIAHQIKCLPGKQEYQSLDPLSHVSAKHVWELTWNFSLEDREEMSLGQTS